MDDIRSVLATHHGKPERIENPTDDVNVLTTAEIPDIFFDKVLTSLKLNRIEILVLVYFYRRVYCRPNLHETYGLTPLLSHKAMSDELNISLDDLYHGLRKLEEFDLIETIRSGQYFIRKYFTKENDSLYGCLLYTSPSPRDRQKSRMPSSA